MTDTSILGFTNTEKPLFELEIGQGIPKLAPRSLDELLRWMQTEQSFWSWIDQAQIANHVPDINRQQSQLPEALEAWRRAKQFLEQGNDSEFKNQITQTQSHLMQRYTSNRALHSLSPKAIFLNEISDAITRGYSLRYFLGFGLASPDNPLALKGTLLAFAFDYGIKAGAAKANELAFSHLLENIGREQETLRINAGALQDQYDVLKVGIGVYQIDQHRAFEEAQAKFSTEHQALVKKSDDDLKNLLKTSTEELQKIADTYDKKMALQVAVTYLDKKAKTHFWTAIWTGLASLAAGGLFILAAVDLGAKLLASDEPRAPPPWHNISVAVLGATLCFWFLRILVRMFLSNLHLETDTKSRSVLMQTYLALLREGGGMKDGEKELILKILFRPFSDGMVRDDAVPPGVWDVVTKSLR